MAAVAPVLLLLAQATPRTSGSSASGGLEGDGGGRCSLGSPGVWHYLPRSAFDHTEIEGRVNGWLNQPCEYQFRPVGIANANATAATAFAFVSPRACVQDVWRNATVAAAEAADDGARRAGDGFDARFEVRFTYTAVVRQPNGSTAKKVTHKRGWVRHL